MSQPDQSRPQWSTRGIARARWHLVFWPTLVSVAIAVIIAVNTVVVLGLQAVSRQSGDKPPIIVRAARIDTMEKQLQKAELRRNSDLPIAIFFGDSTVAGYSLGNQLPGVTAEAIRAAVPSWQPRMFSLASVGTGVGPFACIAGQVARTRPDLVIWQVSFFQFTDRWARSNGVPEITGIVSIARLADLLAMPYERYGLTLSDIFLYQAIERLGLRRVHRALSEAQIRSRRMRERVDDLLHPHDGRTPEARFRFVTGTRKVYAALARDVPHRYNLAGEKFHFGQTVHGIPPDHLALQFLRWGLDTLAAEGIPVLVYLSPANLDHLRTVGLYDEAGIASTVSEIRSAVETSGAVFLDLHDLLKDSEFSDKSGHYSIENGHAVPRRVARRVALSAVATFQEAGERTRARAAQQPHGRVE